MRNGHGFVQFEQKNNLLSFRETIVVWVKISTSSRSEGFCCHGYNKHMVKFVEWSWIKENNAGKQTAVSCVKVFF